MKYAFYAVDELEGQIAILIGDDGSRVEMPLSELPRRLRDAEDTLKKMKDSDRGGDITL